MAVGDYQVRCVEPARPVSESLGTMHGEDRAGLREALIHEHLQL